MQGVWSDKTFPIQNPVSTLTHLIDEVRETINKPDDILEYADCFILLFNAARLSGFTVHDIMNAMQEKHEINTKRQWGKPDANGVVKHIKKHLEPIKKHHPILFMDSDDGILSVYVEGHINKDRFADLIMNDYDSLEILKEKLGSNDKDALNKFMDADCAWQYFRKLSNEEAKDYSGDFEYFLEWSCPEEPGAFPVTSLNFEPN